MTIKAVYDNKDDIPESVEDFRSLFVEKNGKFELTGIQGVKTQGDVDRLKQGASTERSDHKATKTTLAAWSALGDITDVQAKLDKFPALEAASANGGDTQDKIDEAVKSQVAATLKSLTAPMERENKKLKMELGEAVEANGVFKEKDIQRVIHGHVRTAINSEKILVDYHDDVLMHTDRLFELVDGEPVTKDGVGVTPGISPLEWLQDMHEKRAGWWPGSKGGGARGSGTAGGSFATNPWKAGQWNTTAQGAVIRDQGIDKAKQMAESAGSKVGAVRAAKPK